MNDATLSIIPISKARAQLGNLAEKTRGENYVVLTRGGEPKVVLVDFNYLINLQKAVQAIYQKTYLDPKLLPYTREFSDSEIAEWLKEDQL